ncbi:MAG: hypothetical protein ACJA1A_002512 [Saprospiraceae bacterium]|jgi:hypothetical protein
MKIDIPYYIRQVLREQRKVYLPEIGTFILSQTPAQISDDKSRISPPILNVDFKDGISDDKSLVTYIQDTNKFSNTKIDKAIADYSQSTFNKLINVNLNKIEGLGTLIRDEDLDIVSFESNMESFTKEYRGLSSLSIKPIERIKENSVVDYVINTGDQSLRSESKFGWLSPVIAGVMIAALVILFAMLFKKCSEEDTTLFQDPNEEAGILDESPDVKFADTSYEEAEMQTSSALDEGYAEVDQMLDDKSIPDETDAKLNEELKQLIDNSKANKDLIATANPESKKAVKERPIDQNQEVMNTDDPVNQYAEIIPESGTCIIILGTLKRASNITRMISLIERDGKKIHTSQYKGMTRVGFSYDCSSVDIDVYLNEVRKRLSSKAWYLDPIVSIPYN